MCRTWTNPRVFTLTKIYAVSPSHFLKFPQIFSLASTFYECFPSPFFKQLNSSFHDKIFIAKLSRWLKFRKSLPVSFFFWIFVISCFSCFLRGWKILRRLQIENFLKLISRITWSLFDRTRTPCVNMFICISVFEDAQVIPEGLIHYRIRCHIRDRYMGVLRVAFPSTWLHKPRGNVCSTKNVSWSVKTPKELNKDVNWGGSSNLFVWRT